MTSARIADVAEPVLSGADHRLGVALLLAAAINLGVLQLPFPLPRGWDASGGRVEVILVSGGTRFARAPGLSTQREADAGVETPRGSEAVAPEVSTVPAALLEATMAPTAGGIAPASPLQARTAEPARSEAGTQEFPRVVDAQRVRSREGVAARQVKRGDTRRRQGAGAPGTARAPAATGPHAVLQAGSGPGGSGGGPTAGEVHAGAATADTDALPLVRVPPSYPAAARAGRVEGQVLVEFTIRPDGTVAEPEVLEARPAGVFDQVVLRAIRQWRFAPRIEDGEPVSRRARQTVRFALTS